MAKSQGHMMTAFNIGGLVWDFCCCFVGLICVVLFVYWILIVYDEPIILRPEWLSAWLPLNDRACTGDAEEAPVRKKSPQNSLSLFPSRACSTDLSIVSHSPGHPGAQVPCHLFSHTMASTFSYKQEAANRDPSPSLGLSASFCSGAKTPGLLFRKTKQNNYHVIGKAGLLYKKKRFIQLTGLGINVVFLLQDLAGSPLACPLMWIIMAGKRWHTMKSAARDWGLACPINDCKWP